MVQSEFVAGWAMCKRDVIVRDIVKEMDLIFAERQSGADRVYRCIAPALIEEAAVFVESVEKVRICLRSKPVEIANLEVGPLNCDNQLFATFRSGEEPYEVAVIVRGPIVTTQELHGIVLGDMFGMLGHESLDTIPKRRDGLDIFIQTQNEAVLLPIVPHVFERIIANVAVKLNAGFNAPVPFKLLHQGMLEEKSRLEATHVPVADGVSIDDLSCSHVLTHSACFILIDEIGE